VCLRCLSFCSKDVPRVEALPRLEDGTHEIALHAESLRCRCISASSGLSSHVSISSSDISLGRLRARLTTRKLWGELTGEVLEELIDAKLWELCRRSGEPTSLDTRSRIIRRSVCGGDALSCVLEASSPCVLDGNCTVVGDGWLSFATSSYRTAKSFRLRSAFVQMTGASLKKSFCEEELDDVRDAAGVFPWSELLPCIERMLNLKTSRRSVNFCRNDFFPLINVGRSSSIRKPGPMAAMISISVIAKNENN